ncbi:MAG: hypothetical protein RL189_2620 [Pseudomonadota bacterium]|jgi:uncharacterized membrane protein YphA (DoxX/SURF4 family)
MISNIQKVGSVSSDTLRVTFGFIMLAVAVSFISDSNQLEQLLSGQRLPFVSFLLSHLIIAAHLAGGVMLLFGFLTRIAAAMQLPILLGAFGFYMFGNVSAEEYTILQLSPVMLLAAFNIYVTGPGRWSVDYLIGYEDVSETLSDDEDRFSSSAAVAVGPVVAQGHRL